MAKLPWITIALVLGVSTGLPAGLGVFTFVYAKGFSYMTNDPSACANCHVMQGHYDAWRKSSHHNAATCNDCHTPHSLIPKYMTKAENGFHHSMAFTLGGFHEPIEIRAKDLAIVENACRSCHENIVKEIDRGAAVNCGISCTRCHKSVGHLE